MKKLLLLMLLASFQVVVSASNAVTILQKDGLSFSYAFDEKPVVKYSANNLILTTTQVSVEYPISTIKKISFSDTESGPVTDVETVTENPELEIDDFNITIAGAKADATISLIGPDGKTLNSYKADSEGNASFSIAELPDGLYIISSDNLTCKILKK